MTKQILIVSSQPHTYISTAVESEEDFTALLEGFNKEPDPMLLTQAFETTTNNDPMPYLISEHYMTPKEYGQYLYKKKHHCKY